MCRASCSVMTVSSPASPGATIFGPAAETGEEVRLDEAGRDAHVGLQELAIQVDLDACGRRADASERRCVAAVVIDDAAAAQDVRAEHPLELAVGVAAVRARWR